MSYSFSILRNNNFRMLLFTRMAAVLALQSQAIIVGWQVYSLTKDPLMLGLVGLVEAVPAILSALFSGHVVDNNNPLKIYRISFAVLLVNIFALFLSGGGILEMAHTHLVPFLFIGVFISGLARSYIMPSAFSLLPKIIDRENIPGASAWLSSGFQMAAVVGPALAGLIYGGYGALVAWTLPLIFMGIALVFSLNLHVEYKPMLREVKETVFESIVSGWRFILNTKALLYVMTLDMFAVLFGGAVALLPAFADEILHVGSEGLGLLRAAPAIGSGLGALYFAVRPMKVITTKRLLWVVVGFGISKIAFGLSTDFALSLFCLAIGGAFDSVSMIIRGTMMQWLTPDDMRGRVSSVNSMFIISSNEIGAFESGLAARLFGLAPSVVIGGLGTLIVAGMTATSNTFRRLKIRADETK